MNAPTYGMGVIEQRPDGRFRVRVRVEGRYRDLGAFDTREDAEDARAGWAALEAAGEVQSRATTLRQYGARWLDRRELRGRRNIKTDRNRWKNHVMSAPFADWPITNIGRLEVRQWVDSLLRKMAADRRGSRRLSVHTVEHAVNLLRACMRSAIADELIDSNPARGVELPEALEDLVWTYLTPEEQKRLLTCGAIPEAERVIIAFAMGTGLRQGEQWNLELCDLRVEGPSPHVFVQWGKPGHKRPKNGRVRVVPLFGMALDAARRWLEMLPRYAKSNPYKLVFPTERGYRRRDSKPLRQWARWLELAGLNKPGERHDGRPVRWHDLRHTCASSLVSGWWGRAWRLEEVREVLGHRSIETTQRYAHLAPTVIAAAAADTAGLAGVATADARAEKPRPANDSKAVITSPFGSPIDDARAELRAMSERVLRSIDGRNRFARRYAGELAALVLKVTDASPSELPSSPEEAA